MSQSGVTNIVLRQGSGYYNTWVIQDTSGNPVNFSGFTGHAGITYNYSATGFLGEFNLNFISPLSGGTISLSLDSTGAAALPFGRFLYEVNVAPSGNVNSTGVLFGNIDVLPQVY